MAKLTITFENGEIKKELLFQKNTFGYTMKPNQYGGMRGDKPSIRHQFSEKYEDDMDDEIEEYLESIDFGDEDEIKNAVEYLSSME